MTLKTELELLKKDVSDMKHIHSRLDTAITKLTDVSNCINKILAVHEEKLARQEEEIVQNEKEIKKDCLLYTSPSPRDNPASRMPSSA